jgi:hypothetical protein
MCAYIHNIYACYSVEGLKCLVTPASELCVPKKIHSQKQNTCYSVEGLKSLVTPASKLFVHQLGRGAGGGEEGPGRGGGGT